MDDIRFSRPLADSMTQIPENTPEPWAAFAYLPFVSGCPPASKKHCSSLAASAEIQTKGQDRPATRDHPGLFYGMPRSFLLQYGLAKRNR
jgi:hypothetical protein